MTSIAICKCGKISYSREAANKSAREASKRARFNRKLIVYECRSVKGIYHLTTDRGK